MLRIPAQFLCLALAFGCTSSQNHPIAEEPLRAEGVTRIPAVPENAPAENAPAENANPLLRPHIALDDSLRALYRRAITKLMGMSNDNTRGDGDIPAHSLDRMVRALNQYTVHPNPFADINNARSEMALVGFDMSTISENDLWAFCIATFPACTHVRLWHPDGFGLADYARGRLNVFLNEKGVITRVLLWD